MNGVNSGRRLVNWLGHMPRSSQPRRPVLPMATIPFRRCLRRGTAIVRALAWPFAAEFG
jgi:hypothetical protein